MAKKKKSGTKPLTQKELKAMLAKQESNLAAAQERLTQAEETYTSLTTPSPAATIDSDLIRSRVTGLSETQQQAKDTLLDIAEEQGGGYLRTLKSAGQVVPKPTEVLPEGVEWKWSPKTGGSGEWIKVRTSEPFTGGNGGNGGNGGSGGGGGNGSQGSDLAALLASQAARDKLAADQAAAAALEEKRRAGQSAFDLLKVQFDEFGLGGLVADVEKYIKDGLSQAEFTLRLRTESDAYKKRFAANAQRIKAGLRALSEAEYIGLEDQYQNVMRNYGLPASYYARGEMGRQEGFEKFIAGDVSAVELEDRIQTAQNRVTNAPKQVRDALTQFYGAELGNGDILAYVLDPEKALSQIKRKVTAAEIGGGAAIAGLGLGKERAEELGMFGVTGEQARTGYQTIAEFLPTATKLGDIYAKQGLGPYNQAVAESEVFGVTGATDAATKRRKLAQLESAQFSGQVGAAGGALSRERAGQF
jgi:hypothetical protein